MESFAIWYESDEEDIDAKLNINLLKNASGVENPYCLDIGMLIYKGRKIKSVELYIPQEINKEDITDLGKLMISDDVLTRAIFNAKIEVKSSRPDHEEYEKLITIKDGNIDVLLISFDKSSAWEVSVHEGFSIIKINIAKLLDKTSHNFYFRLRIKLHNAGGISLDEPPKWWFLQSAFSQMEVIEFRVNDHRLFNRYIVEQLESKKLFRLKKTHFFIIREIYDEIVDEYGIKDIRLLEPEIWNKYINGLNLKGKLIAYHYCNEKDSDNVLFFSRIRYQKIKGWRVLVYSLGVIFLAIIANICTHMLVKC